MNVNVDTTVSDNPLVHLDDPVINEIRERLCRHNTVLLALEQLVPPAEEEVTSDELEPWSKEAACKDVRVGRTHETGTIKN